MCVYQIHLVIVFGVGIRITRFEMKYLINFDCYFYFLCSIKSYQLSLIKAKIAKYDAYKSNIS